MKGVVQFIFKHSFFIAVCAIFLCAQTYILFKISPDFNLLLFVFMATLCSYNFYWMLPGARLILNGAAAQFLKKYTAGVFIFTSSALTIIVFIVFNTQYIVPVGIAMLLTLLYSLPLWPLQRKWFKYIPGVLKPILLAFTWAYVTVMIPLWGKAVPGSALIHWFAVQWIFVFLLCLLFDKRDHVTDKIHGLSTLANTISFKNLKLVWYACFIALMVLQQWFLIEHQPFLLALVFSILYVYLLALWRLSTTKRGPFFYYFLVDGSMLLSALLTLAAQLFIP